MRAVLGSFGLTAGAIAVALVARHGYLASDTPVDGAIAAFFLATIAIGGIAGPAAAAHLWRTSRLWGAIAGFVAAVALTVNLSNSLGAIAGRADKRIAERQAGADAMKDARAEIARLTARREATPAFDPANEDDVKAARDAVASATTAREAECAKRGQKCRDKEDDEAKARTALANVLSAKGATDQAAGIDARLTALRAKIETAPPVANVNPLADALARLFAVPAEMAATWQQLATVIVVELLIAVSLLAWEILGFSVAGKTSPRIDAGTRKPADDAPPRFPPPVPALSPVVAVSFTPLPPIAGPAPPVPVKTAVKPAPPKGKASQWSGARLMRSRSGALTAGDAFADYSLWCANQGFAAVTPKAFRESMTVVLKSMGAVRSRKNDGVRYRGVALRKAVASRPAAHASMNGVAHNGMNGAAHPVC